MGGEGYPLGNKVLAGIGAMNGKENLQAEAGNGQATTRKDKADWKLTGGHLGSKKEWQVRWGGRRLFVRREGLGGKTQT